MARRPMKSFKIEGCRICGSGGLETVLDLGELVSCGFFPATVDEEPEPTPLALVRCADCTLVQLAHDYEQSELFGQDYGYRSGLNAAMAAHLGTLVDLVKANVTLAPGDTVVDIGSNDCTLLRHYGEEPALRRIGVDPTIRLFSGYYPADVIQAPDFFTPDIVPLIGEGRARAITSISMFYDLPDPSSFVAAIAAALAPDGVWLLEQSYLPRMVDQTSFDTVCHEHLEYYALGPIVRLAETHGLHVADVRFNDVNGGSFQLVVRHRAAADEPRSTKVAEVLAREAAAGYGGLAPFTRLSAQVDDIRAKTKAFFEEAAREGKAVHGYAASTKGNTLLQAFGIGPDQLAAIADVNEQKWGKMTPGSHIPIISEADSRAAKPDYYFALAWHFRDAFIAREAEFLKAGGRIVFPLPRFEIVDASALT